MISVLILTRDEAANLEPCIARLGWCDDVVVLDSHSTDDTVAIAQRLGARVYTRTFDDFASQRNHALDTLAFRHHWVFHLDADERFTDALHAACTAAARADELSGYLVPSKTVFKGRWLRRAGMYPVYQMRFHRLGEVRFVQCGHGQREGESARGIGRIEAPYLHYPFSKGLAAWYRRHERYAREEAAAALADASGWPGLDALFSADATRRRRALKRASYRLPCRGALRFAYMYLGRLGILDGRAGFAYCRMLMDYERMIARHLRELRARDDVPP